MEFAARKIAAYIERNKECSVDERAIYEYGIQTGLEMIVCAFVATGIAALLNMIPQGITFLGIFILLRSYVGGVHLQNFSSCFLCSVFVQTGVLLFAKYVQLPEETAWCMMLLGFVLLLSISPVDHINRILTKGEKKYCRRKLILIVLGILVFSSILSIVGNENFLSLISDTVVVVAVSAVIGKIKFHMDKKRQEH
ncbi:accessory gene regulator B family protein [Mediterraneibacter glycyrrhizinilyticus]|nr:accessory gene regulator B family protein [Mediterraneibacter glycyrrhizinilyticus]MBM6804527.1 accessory gene regulator B family protein [Mediterraneibacter glycyrrhizinilyticus]